MRGFTLFLTIVTFGTLYWNYRISTDATAHYESLEKDVYTIGHGAYIVGCMQSIREQLKVIDIAGGRAEPPSDQVLVKYCDQRAKEFMDQIRVVPLKENSDSK